MKRNTIMTICCALFFIILILFFYAATKSKTNEDTTSTITYSIVLTGPNNITISPGATYQEQGYKVYDINNNEVYISVDVKNNINYNVPGTYEITYSIDGNILATRKVVIEKKENPSSNNYTFELLGGQEITILKDGEFIDPSFIAKSKTGEDVSNNVTVIGGANTTREGRYEIHYVLSKNGERIELIRIVNVVSKNVEFKLNGNNLEEIKYGEKYNEKGYIAKYNGQDYKNNVTITGNVDSTKSGEYELIYTFKTNDFITWLTRVVVVKDKPIPKEIDFKLLGEENVSIYQGEFFDDPGFTALDDKIDYKSQVKITSNLNISTPGKYTISYYLKVDDFEKTLTRNITVEKRLNVNFQLIGNTNMDLEQGAFFFEPGYTAIGEDGIDYHNQVKVTSNLNTNATGTYKIEYRLQVKGYDNTLVRIVNVKQIKVYIDFRLKGSTNITLPVNGTYTEPGFVAGDTLGKDLSSYVKVSGTVNTSKVGTYAIKYTLKYNDYNNTLTRYVTVKGNNYSMTKTEKDGQLIVTIINNTNNFGYYITPDSKKVTSETLTYTIKKNGKYVFNMYDKNGYKIDSITVSVNNIDNEAPKASCSASISNKQVTYNVTATDDSGVSKYVHNGKTYNTPKFTTSSNLEDDVVRVYDKVGNYTDIKCDYAPISSGGRSVITQYDSPTLKYWTEQGGRYFVVTHIWVKDAYNQMNVEVNTNFGQLETTKTIIDNSIRKYGYGNKGMIAINASGFLMNAGSSYENYVKEWRLSPTAPVIFSKGKLVRDFTKYTLPSTTPVYALKQNGYLAVYQFEHGGGEHITNNQKILQQMKNNGVRNTMTFSPVLVENYNRVTNSTDNNIRQALCQIDRNNFVIITNTNGTGNRGVGFNHKAMADYMISLNCRTGYNLDGGGSTNFYYKKNNSTVTPIVSTSRKIADILYFVEQ